MSPSEPATKYQLLSDCFVVFTDKCKKCKIGSKALKFLSWELPLPFSCYTFYNYNYNYIYKKNSKRPRCLTVPWEEMHEQCIFFSSSFTRNFLHFDPQFLYFLIWSYKFCDWSWCFAFHACVWGSRGVEKMLHLLVNSRFCKFNSINSQ